jgi:hypothetical protein
MPIGNGESVGRLSPVEEKKSGQIMWSISCFEIPEAKFSRRRLQVIASDQQTARRGHYAVICSAHAFSHSLGRLLPFVACLTISKCVNQLPSSEGAH